MDTSLTADVGGAHIVLRYPLNLVEQAGPSRRVPLRRSSSGRHAQRKPSPVISTPPKTTHYPEDHTHYTMSSQPTLRRKPSGSVPLMDFDEVPQTQAQESKANKPRPISYPPPIPGPGILLLPGDEVDLLVRDMGRKCGLNKTKRKRVSFTDDIAVIGGDRRVKARRVSEPYNLHCRPFRKHAEDE
ncbi:uncharacterized protein SCHCODRAFT_02515449 [Schizophyllum commune H4-8]|nr:uncharacterized protein SCHCODRAFT_02515449 [Schizophyllum commune H4-8]KAI5887629.1 hypothetical protein SCHCODRAFT_02515449 [Schizophyllum commune H4-8]